MARSKFADLRFTLEANGGELLGAFKFRDDACDCAVALSAKYTAGTFEVVDSDYKPRRRVTDTMSAGVRIPAA